MPTERQGLVADKTPIIYEHPLFNFVSDQWELTANGRTVRLTKRESALVRALATTPNVIILHHDLARAVIGSDYVADSDQENMKTLVCRLRKIFGDLIGDSEVIRTVRGLGYMLVDESRPNDQGSTDQLKKKLSQPKYLRAKTVFTS